MKFLEVKNKTEDSAEIYLYGDIVNDAWEKWTDADKCPIDIRDALKDAEGVQKLDIYINSPGGSVYGGIAIYNMLKRNTAHKTVHIDALAASIASIIAMAGDEIIIPENAFLMVHKPAMGLFGWYNSTFMDSKAKELDKYENVMLDIYKSKLKSETDFEKVKEMVNGETWLTGKEAAEIFNVTVIENAAIAACAGELIKGYKNVPKMLKQEDSDREREEILQNNIKFKKTYEGEW